MRNLQLTFALALALPFFAHAQTMSYSGQSDKNMALSLTAQASPSDSRNVVETPEQARKGVIATLNLLRQFSVFVDEIKKGDTAGEESSETDNKGTYADYLQKMEGVLTRRLKSIETDAIRDNQQAKEKAKILSALNILKSARCLSDKKEGQFARQKDLDGNDIVAFSLDQLKGNARYGLIENYREGFSRIKKDQVFGFLNYCGDEVIPCQYQQAQAFNNGRALVKKLDWFFIDADGNESNALANVVDAQALTQGISIAKFANGKSALIDNRYDVTQLPISGAYDEIVPFSNMEIYRIKNGSKYGLMNIEGKVLLEASYELIEPSGVDNLYRITQNGKVGLMDSDWKIKFPANFDRIENFDIYGLAIAREGELMRLISKNTFQSSALYKSISAFNKLGLAQVQNAVGVWGLINKDLKIVIDPVYINIGNFNQYDLAPACRMTEKCGFINAEGQEIVPPLFADLGEFNSLGVVVVREITKDCNKDKTCKTDWVFNYKGKPILAKPEGSDVKTLKIRYEAKDSLHSERYIAIKTTIDGESVGYHLIDAASYKLITTETYHTISPLDINGMMRIKQGELWGLLDTMGKIVLKPTYLDIRKSSEGFYPIKNERELFGFMDKKGKVVVPFEYDDVKGFRKGHCIVSKGKNKWGLINRFNAKIVPCYFQEVVVNDGTYDLIDSKTISYTIDDKGDCVKNCPKFEEIRRKANQ
jgi:hypothetical protein